MAYESEGSLRIYLREIANTPLLTPEQEIDLAERIKNGDEKARDHMIRANLRLVVKIAKDYANYGLPVMDLISEGNIGLMKAVERFDPAKGGKLSTYAAWWIKQSIKRALAGQSKTVRLPVHMVDKIARMRRIEALLATELGRETTDEEIADITGIPEKKVRFLRNASQRTISLDAPVNEGEATTYGEMMADEHAADPFATVSDKNIHGELGGLLDILNQRERKIIERRFGLNGYKKEFTLEEVGKEFGVTRERIRQVQNQALGKMQKKLKKVEKNMTTSQTRDALISQAQSFIEELCAEGRQKEVTILLKNTQYTNEMREKILRSTPVGKTGKNWYEYTITILELLRRAQGDMSWKKSDVRWSDIATFLRATVLDGKK